MSGTGRELADRHAVVTGGGSGIGLAIAHRLASLGCRLSLMGRDATKLERARAEISGAVATFSADVSDAGTVALAFSQARAAHGPVAILINNAGSAESLPFRETTPEFWRRIVAVNLTGAYLCIRAAIEDLSASGHGRIVNVASTAGLTGYPYVAAYCAAKHGLIGLTRSLALEYAKRGVTVNAVCPGFTDTAIIAQAIATVVERTGRTPEQAHAELTRRNPQGRLVQPEEVADTVAWLCRPAAAAINGQAIAIAGGEVL